MPTLTNALAQQYRDLFTDCVIDRQQRAGIVKLADRLLDNKGRYMKVSMVTRVPWFVIAVIHNLESGMSFHCHLHNGDPLSARTVDVPAGRPITGHPPFEWETSAVDALTFDNLTTWTDWSVSGTLFRVELFNGWGYQKRGTPSPYLWGKSNHYTKGKYRSDGHYDESEVSKQCGAGTMLHYLEYVGAVRL